MWLIKMRKKLILFLVIVLSQSFFLYRYDYNQKFKNTIFVNKMLFQINKGNKEKPGFPTAKLIIKKDFIILTYRNQQKYLDLAETVTKWENIIITNYILENGYFFCKFRLKN